MDPKHIFFLITIFYDKERVWDDFYMEEASAFK